MGQVFYVECPRTPTKDQFKTEKDAERARQKLVKRHKMGNNTHFPNYSYKCRTDWENPGCGYWHNGTRPITKSKMTRAALIEAGIIKPTVVEMAGERG